MYIEIQEVKIYHTISGKIVCRALIFSIVNREMEQIELLTMVSNPNDKLEINSKFKLHPKPNLIEYETRREGIMIFNFHFIGSSSARITTLDRSVSSPNS